MAFEISHQKIWPSLETPSTKRPLNFCAQKPKVGLSLWNSPSTLHKFLVGVDGTGRRFLFPSSPSMSDNPLQPVFQNLQILAAGIRTQICRLFDQAIHPSPTSPSPLLHLFSADSSPLSHNNGGPGLSQPHGVTLKDKAAQPVSREELGRATWTLLHTLGAQYPEKPTRQQRKDVKELMAILSRMYPCSECADHFKEVLRANPVQAGSQADFSQWLCHVHNVVNRSLDKPVFPCERVNARWGKLDCEQRLCDLQGDKDSFWR